MVRENLSLKALAEKADALRSRPLYVRDVYKTYGEKLVLDNVDLAVANGEICSLVGPSGCGKSTLLRLILGWERPSSGEVLVDHSPVGYPDRTRGIVFQKYTLLPNLTVFGNVVLGKQLSLGPIERWRQRKETRDEVMFYLNEVKLAKDAEKYPHELSGGMQQRVAIAQALIMKPKILLMDEPFGALDPDVREHLQIFLLEMWEKFNMTIFFVTHDLEEAIFVGTRILVLSQYYTDERGDGPDVRRGSRIVFDHKLEKHAASTSVKTSSQFGELMAEVRSRFNPAKRKWIEAFDLAHPDSFQTSAAEAPVATTSE